MTPLFFRATCRPVPKRGHVRAHQIKTFPLHFPFFYNGQKMCPEAENLYELSGALAMSRLRHVLSQSSLESPSSCCKNVSGTEISKLN